jgi:hypothetical protein
MRAFVEMVSSQYDAVVFDTAPILPVADTVALLPHVGAMVMVAAAEKVTTTQLRDGLDLANRAGADVIGIVLNGEHRRRSHSSYYGYPRRGGDPTLDAGKSIITESPVEVESSRHGAMADSHAPRRSDEMVAVAGGVVGGTVVGESVSGEMTVGHSTPTMGVDDGPYSDELLVDRPGLTVGRENVPFSDELLLDRSGPMVGWKDRQSLDELPAGRSTPTVMVEDGQSSDEA